MQPQRMTDPAPQRPRDLRDAPPLRAAIRAAMHDAHRPINRFCGGGGLQVHPGLGAPLRTGQTFRAQRMEAPVQKTGLQA